MGMRLQDAPKKENELYGMLYNNLWVVNFCVDSPGEMNFEFDLTYREGKQSVEQLTDMADSYYIPMSIVNTPEALEDPSFVFSNAASTASVTAPRKARSSSRRTP